MTTYLGDKAVGIGTVKAEIGVTGIVLHDDTLVGNGNTEPLGVNKQVVATTNQVANLSATLNAAIEEQAGKITKLDSKKFDKDQGATNAGKYLMVGDDGIVGLTESGGGGGLPATLPTEDGTYVPKCVMSGGVPTMTWVKE